MTHENKNDLYKIQSEEILRQMGGWRKLSLMTGAKNFLYENGVIGIQFKIGKNKKNIQYVHIKLNEKDLYDMYFYNLKKGEKKIIEKVEDVYCDMLIDIFEHVTGFTLSLPEIIII